MSNIKNKVNTRLTTQRSIISFVHRQRRVLGLFLGSLLVIGSLAMAAPSTTRITIGTFAPYYSPTLVHIGTDTPISWDNSTGALHSITHDGCKNGTQCAFDSGPLGPNGTFTVHELPPGSYPYHCSFHPIMRGALIVVKSGILNEA